MSVLLLTGATGAAAALFALSDDASWITGQIIGVDGGLSAGVQAPKRTL